MEKYGFEKEWKEDVLIRKENASTVLVMDGEEVEIDCPEIARGNVSGWGTPCLVSGDGSPEDGKYSVMAFSLDHPKRENKDWICIKPIIFEDAIEYFLTNNYMEEMVNGCMASKRMESKGKAGADFIAGNAYVEINVPDAILNAAGDGWT